MATKAYSIDGKPVKRLLFGRWVVLTQTYFLVEVEAFDKDHALKRIMDKYPHTERRQWDFIDELAPEHFVGRMGESLPLQVL